MYESEKREKGMLLAAVSRLNEAVDSMQSEARDAVAPLPTSGARVSQSRSDSGTEDVVESVSQAVIQRLALIGAIGGGSRTVDGHGEARSICR